MDNKYNIWIKNAKENDLLNELNEIYGKRTEIEDRFYRDLSFGTGGLRGIIGAGTNRMNVYTVKRATAGLASYIIKHNLKKSVVIAYDSRNKSFEFARAAAEVITSFGISAFLFDTIMPTPILSFAIRKLQAGAGIVITASHNPKEYNGYKVYNEKGCQITDKVADVILSEINDREYFEKYPTNNSLIKIIGDELLNEYIETISKLSLYDKTAEYAPSIIYTPLHGTGLIPVQKILKKIGVGKVIVVKEQAEPDSTFDTCPYPNPEEKEALSLALEYGKKYDSEIIIATDPDADRVGIAVRGGDGKFVLLNGNETGLLLMNYMLQRRAENGTLSENPCVIKTIVSSDMAFPIAKKYGATVKEVLTGFKYIGELMDTTDNFVMGMEESYGYLVGAHARDKDAVSAIMLIVEMCAYYKEKGITLYEKLKDLYNEHGYYLTELKSMTYSGASGSEKMSEIIASIRKNPTIQSKFGPFDFTDFAKGINGLPQSDVLRFKSDRVRILIRPSGTEPKLKIYYQVKAETPEIAKDILKQVMSDVEDLLT